MKVFLLLLLRYTCDDQIIKVILLPILFAAPSVMPRQRLVQGVLLLALVSLHGSWNMGGAMAPPENFNKGKGYFMTMLSTSITSINNIKLGKCL